MLAFGGISAALIVATLIPLGFVLAGSHRSGYVDQLERQARTVVAGVVAAPEQQKVSYVAGRFPAGGDVEAVLLDRDGRALNLVTDPGLFPDPPVAASEVRAALRGQSAVRTGTSSQGPRVYVAAPVAVGDKLDGALWLSAVTTPIEQLDGRTWASLGIIGAAGILFSVVVAIAVARQIARRLEVVALGAERFAEGRFAEPIVVGGNDEVAQLGTRLNEMARRIDRAVARERDFAAAASHQLRTPLTAIKLRIEELRATLAPELGAEANENLDEMAQEVDRLTMLASGLLMMAAAEQEGAEMEALPVASAIEQAVGRVRPLARQGGVSVAVSSDADADAVAVRAPRGAFEEVVFNLLDNAVKFSPRSSTVDVSVSSEDGSLNLAVGDRGPGISAEDAEHAFEPFFRSRRAGGVRGSGLGLTICARLCDAAGATIAIAPRDGGGTVAVVRWPLAAGDA